MKLPCSEKQLIQLLNGLCQAVESILLTGMTTASKATYDSLQTAFKEASQMRLLRLGSTLKIAVEEIHRFNSHDPLFSAQRLNFFLNRAWIISHGLKLAIQKKDEKHWQTLTATPSGRDINKLNLVTIGVSKRVVKDTFCAFEYRLRSTSRLKGIPKGSGFIWSVVFPLKKGNKVDPEAFLHLAQKQKFRPIDLMTEKINCFTKIKLIGEQAPFRIILTEQSKVTRQEVFTDWFDFIDWNQEKAYQRLQQHKPTPFELAIELQEEVFLEDWFIESIKHNKAEKKWHYKIIAGDLCFDIELANGDKITQKELKQADKQQFKAPLFGLLHYEACQLRLQPLALIKKDKKPKQLAFSNQVKGAASILRSMNF